MRYLFSILAFFSFEISYCQELDIFQNDSIYSKNRISVRTMYSVNNEVSQKELATLYRSDGRKVKQFWYWNGEQTFHNVETFHYSNSGLVTLLIDSFADGKIETTRYLYKNNELVQQVTLNQNNDTCDLRTYPNKQTTIKRWYMQGEPYRYDTTIFEKENVKLEYYGIDQSHGEPWHYKFKNEFDANGNLTKVSAKVESPYQTFSRYTYDKRGLLIKKEEIFFLQEKEIITTSYKFTYE